MSFVDHGRTEQTVSISIDGSTDTVNMAKSLLDSAGIQHTIIDRKTSNVFSWGSIISAFKYIGGPARIMVAPNDAEAARQILYDIMREQPNPVWFRVAAMLAIAVPAYIVIQMLVTMLRK